jgi:hypothetical protein
MTEHPVDYIDRLRHALVALLIRRIQEEHAVYMAAALLEDLGYDDCPKCLANRRREAWTRWLNRPNRKDEPLVLM